MADEAKSGGGVLDMHIHDTDFALYLLGKPDAMASFGSVDNRGPSHAFTTMRFGPLDCSLGGGLEPSGRRSVQDGVPAVFEKAAMIWDAGPMTVYEDTKDFRSRIPQDERRGRGGTSATWVATMSNWLTLWTV